MAEYQSRDDLSTDKDVVVRPRRERVAGSSEGHRVVMSASRQLAAEPNVNVTVLRDHRAARADKPDKTDNWDADPVLVSTLKDMAVVSLADGTKVGAVKDVFFDTRHQRIVAFTLASEDGEFLLAFDAVRNIGPDALTVDTAGCTQELRRLADLSALKAVNVDGTLLGEVKELEVDRSDGRLTALTVHRGGLLGLGGTQQSVPASAVRSIGPAVAMVDVAPASG